MYIVYTMNTAVINIKTEPETKKQAQKVARDIGMSLSTLINSYLKQVIRTQRVELSVGEEPSERLKQSMRQAEKDLKAGKASPTFNTGEEAVAWLEKQGI